MKLNDHVNFIFPRICAYAVDRRQGGSDLIEHWAELLCWWAEGTNQWEFVSGLTPLSSSPAPFPEKRSYIQGIFKPTFRKNLFPSINCAPFWYKLISVLHECYSRCIIAISSHVVWFQDGSYNMYIYIYFFFQCMLANFNVKYSNL